MNAIETHGLSKSYRKIPAVQNLDLHVPEGSIYGFIGENGSGKSTTEKLICGLLVPTEGEIRLYDKPYTDTEIRSRLGVLIENPAYFPNSTVYQNMMMQAMNLDVKKPHNDVRRVLELVNLTSVAGRKFKECSLGMKQRIGVAQSLLGNPRLLILDEPINGLDADGMRIVRETLVDLNRKYGVTILISSHILGELSKIATHYGIIRQGTLVREVPASAMSEECRNFVFVKTNNNPRALQALRGKYAQVEPNADGIRIYNEEESANVSGFLFENGIAVSEISFQKVGLEEYYLQTMTERKEVNKNG